MRYRVGIRDLGAWAAWLSLALELMGCAEAQRAREPDLKALAPKLNEIEAIRLEERSQSEPVTIEEATEQLSKKIAEPNQARPMVELTLEEVRAAALANNLELKVELVDPAIAQQAVDVERAKFEAVFLGSARHGRTELTPGGDPVTSRTYEASIEKPLPTGTFISAGVPLRDSSGVSEAAASVSVIQSLLRGAGTRINTQSIRIATYSKGIVDAGTKLAAIRILGDADIAYWNLYAARKQLDVAREQYKLAQNQLRHARNKVQSGAAGKYEIVQAEAGLSSRLEDAISRETEVRDRERDIRRVMNRQDMPLHSETAIIPLTDPNPQGLDLDPEAMMAEALSNRMEMIQFELALAINDLDVELAKNDTLPRLDLAYSYTAAGQAGSTGRALDTVFDRPTEDHTVGVSAVVPLGNRAAQARLRRARLERVRSQVNREITEQFIRQEVYEVVDGLEQNWRRILAAEQGTVTAHQDYQVAQQRFQLGQIDSTLVLLAASRLADAQLRRIAAFVGYEVAQVRVARATGTLLGRSNVQLQPTPVEGK